MVRLTAGLPAVLALLVPFNSAAGVLLTVGRYRILAEGFESGVHDRPPEGWTTGGGSVQLVRDPGAGGPAPGVPGAAEGDRYLFMGNNPVPTGFARRQFAPLQRGQLRLAWLMYIPASGAAQAGGTINLRTSGPAELRAGVSYNRATVGHASCSVGGGDWVDAGIPFVAGKWQTWIIAYRFDGPGAADDTWTLSIDGKTSVAFAGGTAGPDDIGEVLIGQANAAHDFFVDMAPPPVTAPPVERSRPEDFGTHWVRSHPFTIMGLTALRQQFDPQQYRDGGFGPALAFKDKPFVLEALSKAGIPYHYRVQPENKGPVTDPVKAQVAQIVEGYPGAAGIFMYDEPKWIHMPDVARGNRWIRETWPHLLTYTNANPIGGNAVKYYGKEPPGGSYTYAQYIADVVSLTESDLLCFDVYPFGGAPGHSGVYFLNLEIIRREALKAGIPYWTIVQSFEVELEGLRRRLPSDSDLRMQVFSSLAYGFTGILYFCYDNVFERGLTEAGGRPNRLYYAAAAVNAEIANLGQALRFLTSRQVLHVRGSHVENGDTVPHAAEAGTSTYDPAAGSEWSIRSILIEEQAPGRDALLGLFQDDDGGRYLMLVNLWHSQATSAARDRVRFTIAFDPSVRSIARLSRETGRPEVLAVSGGVLPLTLPGGTGDLFKIGDAEFPGLQR